MAKTNKQFKNVNITLTDNQYTNINILAIDEESDFIIIDIISNYKTNNDSVDLSNEYGSQYSEISIDSDIEIYQSLIINKNILNHTPKELNFENDGKVNIVNIDFENLIIYDKDDLISALGEDIEDDIADQYEKEINEDLNYYAFSGLVLIETL